MNLSFLKYLGGIYNTNLFKSNRVHYAIINALYGSFIMAQGDLNLMRLEMCLKTATGKWLDTWGEYFDIHRRLGEEDRVYSQRIIDTIINPKSTIPAIQDGLKNYLNYLHNTNYERKDIIIREPWKEVGKYSHRGTLSHTARLYSHDYYTHAIIDIAIPENLTSDIKEFAKSIKAAGVQIVWTNLNWYDGTIDSANSVNGGELDNNADYHRHIQTRVPRKSFSGLQLSNTSDKRTLDGSQEIWYLCDSHYEWYAKVSDKDTDNSIIITKLDLINMLDTFTRYERKIDDLVLLWSYLSGGGDTDLFDNRYHNSITEVEFKDENGYVYASTKIGTLKDTYLDFYDSEDKIEGIEKSIEKVTEEMLELFNALDILMSLSCGSKVTEDDLVKLEQVANHELFLELLDEVHRFRDNNRYYYNQLQPPILNGERVNWYGARQENWLWDTPLMSNTDLNDLWDPFSDEYTLGDLMQFEENNPLFRGYMTFGEVYQPPIVLADAPINMHTIVPRQECIWESPVFTCSDISEIYLRNARMADRNFKVTDVPTFADAINSDKYFLEGYSVAHYVQPIIEIKTENV